MLSRLLSPFACLSAVLLPGMLGAQIAPAAGAAQPAGAGSSVNASAGGAVAAAPAPAMDATAAVKSVIATFTLNDAVNVPATGKPLGMTGAWGAQTKFPEGTPKPCVEAAVPCIRVVYNVPDAKVRCEWLLGYLVAVEPDGKGGTLHAVHQVVLDENADAARYTMRKGWARGESRPVPVSGRAPAYPAAAHESGTDGTVAMRFEIAADGSIAKIVHIEGPKLLQGAVTTAVGTWKFKPPMVGTQSTTFLVDEIFRFTRAREDFSEAMELHGGDVSLQSADPHYGPGFVAQSSTHAETWQSCDAQGCVQVGSPSAPQ